MAGNFEGGLAAAITNKSRYGSNYYERIGKIGGSRSRGGGFTSETAAIWGALGGSMSSRGHKLTDDERLRKRLDFQKKYEKTLAMLERIHAEAMKEKRG